MLATDIDTNVLNRRAAVYPAERVAKMEESRLKRFFLKGRGANAGQVRVRPEIADMVRYDTLNLLAPSWPINEKFDAIFCRNVMIYFDKPTQARILERFVPLLKPGGLLFAGHSENFTYISQDFRLRGQTVYEWGPGLAAQAAKMQKIRVLCVDDSALVRGLMTEIINSQPDMEVVATAPDPLVARELIKRHNPDVLTLDVEMPRMDGLDFLES